MGFDDRDAGRRDVEGDIRSVLRCQSPEWTTVDSNKDGQDFQLITLNRKKKITINDRSFPSNAYLRLKGPHSWKVFPWPGLSLAFLANIESGCFLSLPGI